MLKIISLLLSLQLMGAGPAKTAPKNGKVITQPAQANVTTGDTFASPPENRLDQVASAPDIDTNIMKQEIMDDITRGIVAGPQVFRYPNRQNAIDFAVSLATSRDLIIITGKGHEKSICRGHTEYPWSDQTAVKKALKLRS